MSFADFVVPFGIRILEDGTEKTVYLDDIGATEDDVAANYGRRCGLVCPECGQPILAVRRQQGNNGKGFKCFAHASGASAHCEGYGERSSHKAAEDMLSNGIGESFWLPAVNVSDLVAHTSRYSDSGTARDEVMEVFESREDVNNRGRGIIRDDCHISDAVECIVDRVWLEHDTDNAPIPLPSNKRPDAVVEMHENGSGEKHTVAVEFRYAHAKSLEDMQAFYEAGTSVVEILLPEVRDGGKNMKRELHDAVFGCSQESGKDGRSVPNIRREWLYNAESLSSLDTFPIAVKPKVFIDRFDLNYDIKGKAEKIATRYVRRAFKDAAADIKVNGIYSDMSYNRRLLNNGMELLIDTKITDFIDWKEEGNAPSAEIVLEYVPSNRGGNEQRLPIDKQIECIESIAAKIGESIAEGNKKRYKACTTKRIIGNRQRKNRKLNEEQKKKEQAQIKASLARKREEQQRAAMRELARRKEEEYAEKARRDRKEKQERESYIDGYIENMTRKDAIDAFNIAVLSCKNFNIRPVTVFDIKRRAIPKDTLFGIDTVEGIDSVEGIDAVEYRNVANYLVMRAKEKIKNGEDDMSKLTDSIFLSGTKTVQSAIEPGVALSTISMYDDRGSKHSIMVGVPCLSEANGYARERAKWKNRAFTEIRKQEIADAIEAARTSYIEYPDWTLPFIDMLAGEFKRRIETAVYNRGGWSYLA